MISNANYQKTLDENIEEWYYNINWVTV
jgi:hypothetical protein